VQLLDRCLFQTKRLILCTELCCHSVTPPCVSSQCWAAAVRWHSSSIRLGQPESGQALVAHFFLGVQ
jgi:hypothetical protein